MLEVGDEGESEEEGVKDGKENNQGEQRKSGDSLRTVTDQPRNTQETRRPNPLAHPPEKSGGGGLFVAERCLIGPEFQNDADAPNRR